mgnify:CR=1 FL=1
MFLLRHYEGMSYEEIAAVMSRSPGTAKKSVWRALGKLRAKFEVGEDARPQSDDKGNTVIRARVMIGGTDSMANLLPKSP